MSTKGVNAQKYIDEAARAGDVSFVFDPNFLLVKLLLFIRFSIYFVSF